LEASDSSLRQIWRAQPRFKLGDDLIHMLENKQSTTVQELYEGLPGECKEYFKHVRSLGFDEAPNYAYLRRMFGNLFRRKGYEYDHVFDWTELKFLEHLERRRKDLNTVNARLTHSLDSP